MVGGPNGVGKTTFARHFLNGFQYINGDEIFRQAKFSGSSLTSFELREIVNQQIQQYISQKVDFAFESNLVSNYSYELVQDIGKKGFETILYFLGATDLEVLNERIAQRVAVDNLHYVSPADVRSRFKEAIDKLPINLKYFDKAIFFDNSFQGVQPTEVLHLSKGIVTWESPALPLWLVQIMPSIKRLSDAYQGKRHGKL